MNILFSISLNFLFSVNVFSWHRVAEVLNLSLGISICSTKY